MDTQFGTSRLVSRNLAGIQRSRANGSKHSRNDAQIIGRVFALFKKAACGAALLRAIA